jgi:hypothetical protein
MTPRDNRTVPRVVAVCAATPVCIRTITATAPANIGKIALRVIVNASKSSLSVEQCPAFNP